MEEHSNFIWQLIEHTPVLRQKIQNLDRRQFINKDEQILEYIDFFKDLDLTLEEIITSFRIPSQHLFSQTSKPLNT